MSERPILEPGDLPRGAIDAGRLATLAGLSRSQINRRAPGLPGVLFVRLSGRVCYFFQAGERIELVVAEIRPGGTQVRLGVEAPESVRVVRGEIEDSPRGG